MSAKLSNAGRPRKYKERARHAIDRHRDLPSNPRALKSNITGRPPKYSWPFLSKKLHALRALHRDENEILTFKERAKRELLRSGFHEHSNEFDDRCLILQREISEIFRANESEYVAYYRRLRDPCKN